MSLKKDFELDNEMERMSDRTLLETIAHRVNDMCALCERQDKRITKLEHSDRRATLIGTVTGAGVSLLIAIGSIFVKRQ